MRPSPLMGALLAVVIERPGYGYELALRLQERLGPAWKVDASSIYPLLDRLEDLGLIRREVKDRPGDARRQRRERTVHYATELAEEARRSWMERPLQREAVRTELLAKMAVARRGDEPFVVAALDDYERDILGMLEEHSVDERAAGPELEALVLALVDDYVNSLLRGEREWVIRARRRLMEHREEGGG